MCMNFTKHKLDSLDIWHTPALVCESLGEHTCVCVRVLEAKHTEQTSQLDSLTWLSHEAGQMPGPGHVQGWAGQQAPRVLVNSPH